MVKTFDSFIEIDIETPITVALTKLRLKTPEHFILVTDHAKPISLVRKRHLVDLVRNRTHTLEDLKDKLLPIFTLDKQVYQKREYEKLLPVLIEAKAPGALVRSGTSYRVASLSRLEGRLKTGKLSFSTNVPVRTYVCLQCDPPSRKRPISGPVPDCDLGHGPMVEEG